MNVLSRPAAAVLVWTTLLFGFSAPALCETISKLDDVVVTGTRSSQSLGKVTATMQVFDRERLANSPAESVTDFLAENGMVFFSQWAPGQTSVTLRGIRSDGQGRDFKSGVLVLINGRRAGTANLSKLSLDQLHRIEIIRGPASVSYGSQAMGGVINLITRNGLNTRGGHIDLSAGSFDRFRGGAGYAGQLSQDLAAYVGANGETRDDYEGGKGSGTLENTEYTRYGGLGALNWTPTAHSSLDLTVRSDGVYDSGFRGSSYDLDNDEDRYNQSVDLQYQTDLPGLNAVLNTQAFLFRDLDKFRWGSEASGYDVDNTTREQTGYGLKISPEFSLTPATLLVLGVDVDYSELRNERYRYGTTGPVSQAAPYDMNQDVLVLSGFSEINQSWLSDRLNLNAGIRYTHSDLTLVDTPYRALTGDRDATESHITYSTGMSYRFTPGVKGRISYATGFRTPTGAELAGEYSTVLSPGKIYRGNPDLDPETSRQYEAGLTYAKESLFLDLAIFDNTITDRIATRLYANDGTTRIYRYENNSGDAHIQGIELQAQYDFSSVLGLKGQGLTLGLNGSYNFTMEEDGAESADSGPYADKVQRMSEYQGSAVVTYAWKNKWRISLVSTLYGPMHYDTEEKLTATAQSAGDYVHRKGSFALFNLRGRYAVTDGLTLFAGIDNLLDKNYHPMFIQIDDGIVRVDTSKTNGGLGNSLAGRNVYAGITYTF